jgi:hypothetical protein
MAKRATSSRAVRPTKGREETSSSSEPKGVAISGGFRDRRNYGQDHFPGAVRKASAQATVVEKVQTLLTAMKDPDHGTKHRKLDREALAYYLQVGRTDKAGISSDQWKTVISVYKNHIEPYFMTGTQEERNAFALSLPWLFRPEEIMAYGLGTGCASTAPVFAVLARMAGMQARLAISVLASDFPKACPNPDDSRRPNVNMDGHQIVMVEQDEGGWGALNSSMGRDAISTPALWWATDLDGNKLEWDKPEDAVDAWVKYNGMPGEYVIRGVESEHYDLLLVRNFNTCKNVQASGIHSNDIVRALPPRP